MKKLTLIILALIASINVYSQAKKKANNDTKNWRYEIEAVQQGVQGTYLIKVWSYSKKPQIAIEQAKKNAVHGIIFKGFAGSGGVSGQKPLAQNPNLEIEKEDFFNEFFQENGKYQKFVSISGDGSVAAEDRLKVGKEYKIGVVVSVLVSALREDLETSQIIKKLSSGF